MKLEEADAWSIEDADELHDDLGEAIGYCLENYSLDETLPEKLTARAYRRMTAEVKPDYLLEMALEHLDEELGNPEGDPTEPNEAMTEAARAFAEVIEREYWVWACEPTGETVEIDVQEWVQENEPQWLENRSISNLSGSIQDGGDGSRGEDDE